MSSKKSGTGWVTACCLCLATVFAAGFFALTVSGGGQAASSVPARSSLASGGARQESSAPASSASGTSAHIGSLVQSAELRAVWVVTVYNIDYPSRAGLSAAAQKAEADTLLDNVKKWGMNAVFLQVRGNADALYKSSVYPWSSALTGTQGKDPGYDPLAYFAQGAHKRGLKLVAWVNPYRISSTADTSRLAASNPAKLHGDWVVKTSGGELYFNPGIPEVRAMVENGVIEIVKNYDVDGIVFDDYFYPGRDFNDKPSWQKYSSGAQLDDWRRNNVTALISELHGMIGSAKSGVHVAFGVSPFAVWANKSANARGSDTSAGVQSYYDQYADTRLWVQKKYVDFVAPQIYWSVGFDKAPYEKVLDWWAETVRGTGVDLYVAHSVSKVGSSESGWKEPDQIIKQLKLADKYTEYKGSCFYSYSKLVKNALGVTASVCSYYGGAS